MNIHEQTVYCNLNTNCTLLSYVPFKPFSLQIILYSTKTAVWWSYTVETLTDGHVTTNQRKLG